MPAKTTEEIRQASSCTQEDLPQRIQMAKQFIDINFLQIKAIKEIAAHCQMSEYSFFRQFKEVYKKTPYQYITEQKMHLAICLLKTSKHSISDIAFSCSFSDVFTFSKAFKKFYGMPPSLMKQSF